MNVIKNKFLILIICLCLFISCGLSVNAITITSGAKVTAGSGSWTAWANKKYDGKKLLYCSQKNKDAPNSCSKTTEYNVKYSAAVSYIINNTSNYICAENLINKFLYNYYKTGGRTNPSLSASSSGGNSNWVSSCPNASEIYANAKTTFDTYENLSTATINYNKTSIPINNSGTAEVTLSYNSNYEPYCTVNYGNLSISGKKVTITGANDRRLKLSCIPRKSFTRIKSYQCGDSQNLLGQGDSEKAYGKKTILPVKTSYTFLFYKYHKYFEEGNNLISLTTTRAYNSELIVPKNPFSRAGYVFKGWKVHRGYGDKWWVSGIGWTNSPDNAKIYKSGSKYTIDNSWVGTLANTNFHFVAQWDEAKVKISYNANGGTGTMSSHETKYNETFTIKSNQFQRSGYKFIGWTVKRKSDSTNSDGTWYVPTYGWTKQSDINKNAYKKKIYSDVNNNPVTANLNDSWFGKKPDTEDKYVDEFTFYAEWEPIPDREELKVNKVYKKTENPDTYAPILSPATFNIYDNSSCTGEAINTVNTANGSGTANFDLGSNSEVTYYIQEKIPPKNYEIDNTCYPVTIRKGQVNEIQIVNKSNCNTELDNILETYSDTSSTEYRNELINLYSKYKQNALLNFESPSCEVITNCYSNNISCLSGNYILEDSFHKDNLSCFNDKITNNDGNIIAFCSTTLNIENMLEMDNGVYSNIIAGQVLLQKDDDTSVVTSKVISSCYYLEKPHETNKNIKIPTLKLSGTTLIPVYDGNVQVSGDNLNISLSPSLNIDEYRGSAVFEYFLPKIYAKRISGRLLNSSGTPYNESCLDCKYLGRGIASQFNSENGFLSFEYSTSIDSTKTNIINQRTDSCPYNARQELITYESKSKGQLQLEFRTVDPKKPFERDTKSNWCSNEEGIVNCNNENNLVNSIIKNRTNSYGISSNSKQEAPIYKITLTPSDIKHIKEYNKSAPYDNYLYECTKSENNDIECKNKFLINLAQGKVFDPLDNLIGDLSTNLTKIIKKTDDSNSDYVIDIDQEEEQTDKELYEEELEE